MPDTKNQDLGKSKKDPILKEILKRPIMKKFQLYGFLKNLQFFEPFIFLIFIGWGYSLFEIGILVLIQQIIIFLLEIPSGVLADNFGKKTELLVCFTFYIISFIFYFLGPSYVFILFGAVFYGLGEAFRSGTHKAMELDWMEKHDLLEYKALIYGQTRSWSLYGSALNSIFAILFVFILPADKWIFLIATIPFLLDFALIATYPKYMNIPTPDANSNLPTLLKKSIKNIGEMLKSVDLRKSILSSSSYDAIFKGLKDYIQPIMTFLIVYLCVDLQLDESNQENYTKLILGILYAIFYILSSFSSRNAYRFTNLFSDSPSAYNLLFDLFGAALIIIGGFYMIGFSWGVIFFYLIIYMFYNMRRPILVGHIGNQVPSEKRATILSVEAQSKSIITAILAPIFGLIADISIPLLFFVIGGGGILVNWLYFRKNGKKST
ncbi:MAG: MFS transporter [Promethearchaeota archaeon]